LEDPCHIYLNETGTTTIGYGSLFEDSPEALPDALQDAAALPDDIFARLYPQLPANRNRESSGQVLAEVEFRIVKPSFDEKIVGEFVVRSLQKLDDERPGNAKKFLLAAAA
jgi:hypothetical protein